jgi:DNA (cytosine-5)-methyltransferase 1
MRRIAEGMRRFVFGHPNPFLIEIANYGGKPRASSINDPLRTVTSFPKGGAFALCMPFIAKHFGGMVGVGADTPFPTITGRGTQNQIVQCTIGGGVDRSEQVHAFLMKYYSEGGQWQDLREPLHTVPTKDRMALVTARGALPNIRDIGMRMLAPHELYRAQGFPADYIIDRDAHGNKFTKTAQVAKCGNSVCPPLAAALVRANMAEQSVEVAA